MERKVIAPTVGRVVWFRHNGVCRHMNILDPEQPMKADVVFVHPDGKVNLTVFDHRSNQHDIQNLTLVQEGDDKPADEPYCEWMPYQIGQAKKEDAQSGNGEAAGAR